MSTGKRLASKPESKSSPLGRRPTAHRDVSERADRRFWWRVEAFQERCFAAGRVVNTLPATGRAPSQVIKMLDDLKHELDGLTGNYDILAMMGPRK